MTKGKSCKEKPKSIHPDSRKAGRALSKVIRDTKIKKQLKERGLKASLLASKLEWFQENLTADKHYYTLEEIQKLIEIYLQRYVDTSEKSEVATSSTKQSFKSEANRMMREQESQEYKTVGLVVPDLTAAKNVQAIRNWNGEKTQLPSIRMSTIKISDGRKKTKHSISEAEAMIVQ